MIHPLTSMVPTSRMEWFKRKFSFDLPIENVSERKGTRARDTGAVQRNNARVSQPSLTRRDHDLAKITELKRLLDTAGGA